jgi:hypothetical protein
MFARSVPDVLCFAHNTHKHTEGDWVHGLKDGEGVYTYANGAKYMGKWKNDVQWGDDNNYALSSGEDFNIDIPQGFPPGSDGGAELPPSLHE